MKVVLLKTVLSKDCSLILLSNSLTIAKEGLLMTCKPVLNYAKQFTLQNCDFFFSVIEHNQ